MKRTRRFRLTYANAAASLALFVALGGSSYAAVAITGKQVRDGSLSGRDIRDGSLTGRDVGNHSLLARDFKSGQLPQGAKGDPGPPGPAGTPNGYTKTQADGRFLQGNGDAVFAQSLLDPSQTIAAWMSVNGVAHLQISCAPGGQGTLRLVSDTSGIVDAFANSVINTSAEMAEYSVSHQGDGVNVLVETFDSQETLQVLSGNQASTQLTTLVISVLDDVNGGCRFVAHAIHSSSGDPLT